MIEDFVGNEIRLGYKVFLHCEMEVLRIVEETNMVEVRHPVLGILSLHSENFVCVDDEFVLEEKKEEEEKEEEEEKKEE